MLLVQLNITTYSTAIKESGSHKNRFFLILSNNFALAINRKIAFAKMVKKLYHHQQIRKLLKTDECYKKTRPDADIVIAFRYREDYTGAHAAGG
jgi:hypothetical protein